MQNNQNTKTISWICYVPKYKKTNQIKKNISWKISLDHSHSTLPKENQSIMVLQAER